jgi:hypothetical protein
MPIYEVDCPIHGRVEICCKNYRSVEEAPCPKCGKVSPRCWDSVGGPEYFIPYYTEAFNLGRPVYVGSKEEEKALLQKTGCERVN